MCSNAKDFGSINSVEEGRDSSVSESWNYVEGMYGTSVGEYERENRNQMEVIF